MRSSQKVFFNKVKQFLDEKGCVPVEAHDHFLLISCQGQPIEIRLVDSIRKAPKSWQKREKDDDSDRYAFLLSPDRFVLFQNFIDCVLAGSVVNARRNYNLLRMSADEMERLTR